MRRALCVGIDEYGEDSLRGCVSDAQRMHAVLSRHENDSPNFDSRMLVAPVGEGKKVVTRPILREQLEQLFGDKADLAFLHFSGHGTTNSLGGFLVTQDATRYDDGVPMRDVLQLANASPVSEVVITLDCCHSGAFGNLPEFDNATAQLREGVSVLTASRGDQPSVEQHGGGLFTSLVVDALEGGAADLLGEVTAASVYAYVEAALGAWEQRPLFKAHVSRLRPIRCCIPPVDKQLLRRLPELFPLPAEDLPLDPSYEDTSDASDAGHVKTFKELQELYRVHIVVSVDAPHMYGAAMKSTACRLTDSGRYYWRLAKDRRI